MNNHLNQDPHPSYLPPPNFQPPIQGINKPFTQAKLPTGPFGDFDTARWIVALDGLEADSLYTFLALLHEGRFNDLATAMAFLKLEAGAGGGGSRAAVPQKTRELIEKGKTLFQTLNGNLRQKICIDWDYCERSKAFSKRIETVSSLSAFLGSIFPTLGGSATTTVTITQLTPHVFGGVTFQTITAVGTATVPVASGGIPIAIILAILSFSTLVLKFSVDGYCQCGGEGNLVVGCIDVIRKLLSLIFR